MPGLGKRVPWTWELRMENGRIETQELDFACEHCGAKAGEPCWGARVGTMTSPHDERHDHNTWFQAMQAFEQVGGQPMAPADFTDLVWPGSKLNMTLFNAKRMLSRLEKLGDVMKYDRHRYKPRAGELDEWYMEKDQLVATRSRARDKSTGGSDGKEEKESTATEAEGTVEGTAAPVRAAGNHEEHIAGEGDAEPGQSGERAQR